MPLGLADEQSAEVKKAEVLMENFRRAIGEQCCAHFFITGWLLSKAPR